MKAAQMAECLLQIAQLLNGSDGAKIQQLSEVVGQQGAQTFSSYCMKVDKALSSKGLTRSDTAAAKMLRQLGAIVLAAGAVPLSKDFVAASRLIELLNGVGEVRSAIDMALTPQLKKPKKVAKPAPIDPRAAADQLTDVTQDRTRFETLLAEVAKLSKVEFAEVAKHYLGFERSYKNKGEITKAIRARQIQDSIDGSREARGTKIAI